MFAGFYFLLLSLHEYLKKVRNSWVIFCTFKTYDIFGLFFKDQTKMKQFFHFYFDVTQVCTFQWIICEKNLNLNVRDQLEANYQESSSPTQPFVGDEVTIVVDPLIAEFLGSWYNMATTNQPTNMLHCSLLPAHSLTQKPLSLPLPSFLSLSLSIYIYLSLSLFSHSR